MTAADVDSLARYWAKRAFSVTSEPRGQRRAIGKSLSFVIQKHAASRLHYDFRLELDGVLVSWAVPKGPSYDPTDKRMAIHVEDHPLSYGAFEGIIPPKQYGAGTVIVWDNGTWEPVGDPHEGLAEGKLVFRMFGQKMAGLWELVKIAKGGERQEPWILLKKRDEFARPRAEYDVVTALPDSVIAKPLKNRRNQGGRQEVRTRTSGRPWRCERGVAGQADAATRHARNGRTVRRTVGLRNQVRRLPRHDAHRERTADAHHARRPRLVGEDAEPRARAPPAWRQVRLAGWRNRGIR
jgi:bifunctional non-homologous end joining protein LigD